VTRVAFVSPEPTPYRSPLLDRVAADGEIDLTVVYAAHTVAKRTWKVEPLHRAVFLDGLKIPGLHSVFRHDYPVTPGIWRALREARPDCVVVSGWSTFAAQAALTWCRARRVPYVLLVESHDVGPKPGWRRRVKGIVVPPIVKRAASVLVTGSLARESMLAQGAVPERVRVFANTIDVVRYGERADELAERRHQLRAELGLPAEDVAVLTVARLAPEKGIDVLLRAVAQASLPVVVLGEGPERLRLEQLARELDVRATFTSRSWDRVVEAYAAADVFALLSAHEPWGVVVNEAAACGLPLVLSERVGAARDLLLDGENGVLVPAGDADAAAVALRRLADDPALRAQMGERSRELARGFGYGPSVDNLLAAVREATASR
jgi:glycosyltransferase involved in cell wall biosynthesis